MERLSRMPKVGALPSACAAEGGAGEGLSAWASRAGGTAGWLAQKEWSGAGGGKGLGCVCCVLAGSRSHAASRFPHTAPLPQRPPQPAAAKQRSPATHLLLPLRHLLHPHTDAAQLLRQRTLAGVCGAGGQHKQGRGSAVSS